MRQTSDTALPSGWALPTLEAVADVNPKIDKSAYPDSLTVLFVPMPAVEAGTNVIDLSRTRVFGEVKKGYTPFREGDVLFAKITPCMENGKIAVVPALKNGLAFGSTEFHVLRPHCHVIAEYLYFFLSTRRFRRDAQRNMTGAVGQRRVPTSFVAEHPIPLPPTVEQARIVAKINTLFSELDKGIESLTTARRQLEVYRQSVLKHAFEGKLTAQWRAENKERLETPDQLLGRIREERAAHHERQLGEWKAAVRAWETKGQPSNTPTKPRTQADLAQLTSSELAILPPLPENHAYTYLANLGELERGKSKHRPRNAPELFGGSYPFIQTGDVKAANRTIRDYSQTYSECGLQQSRLWPEGTLCITIAANIAETALLGFDSCFPDSIVGFTATDTLVSPRYVRLFIQSVRKRIEAYAPATAQKNINQKTLQKLVIPLCSLEEQRVLVDQLETIMSVVDKQEATINRLLIVADVFRQSVLKKAFSGQLVSQDPHDEPVAVLYDRIKTERKQEAKSTTGPRGTKRKATL